MSPPDARASLLRDQRFPTGTNVGGLDEIDFAGSKAGPLQAGQVTASPIFRSSTLRLRPQELHFTAGMARPSVELRNQIGIGANRGSGDNDLDSIRKMLRG